MFYDALVDAEALRQFTSAPCFCVGKRAGRASVKQETINRLLIRGARQGKHVVRLKGGDPFVFGRGGEEALALEAAGVSFDVVPGVSSAFAAAAAASIPVTYRGVSSAVLVVTGHDVDRFSSVAASIAPGAATLVVLMGTERRARIGGTLLAAGWRAATPAAIVRDATLATQTVWTGRLDALAGAPDADGPGTIVIGDVVTLRDGLLRQAVVAEQEVRHG